MQISIRNHVVLANNYSLIRVGMFSDDTTTTGTSFITDDSCKKKTKIEWNESCETRDADPRKLIIKHLNFL